MFKLFRQKRDVFKFSSRKHSVRGMFSLAIGIITGIALLVLSYISSLTAGKGSLLLGVLGMVLLGLSIFGLVLGIKGCKEKEIYYTAPIAGVVLNGLFSLIYFILYMVGISISL